LAALMRRFSICEDTAWPRRSPQAYEIYAMVGWPATRKWC
jgi:hypothetical protein